MKLFSTLLLAAGLPFMMQAAEPTDTVTVFMIGDSTMANKPLAKENQERGWGQMLPVYLQGKIKVDNHAVNGRSSKSFINEGRWDKVMSLIRPGDYVIIQFGHNDEKPKNDRHTDPGSTFDENLRRFVNDTKSKGATPILMNSIVRRNFPPMAGQDIASESDDKQKDWKGMYPNEGVILVDTHGAYLDSPRNVAAETGVTFVDMNKLTHELVQTLGANNSRDLFMWISPNTYEFCPKGKIDNTHLNVHGALIVSRLAVNALAKQMPELRQYIRPEIYNLN
ncbi:MAG: rhamnogalacturonan acetylesterase [Duncaniella sp.]|nr:rhamnogalacturonan acetylesterase [Duncaniella sp.]